jgi:uncharacterized protein (DUF4415 family)
MTAKRAAIKQEWIDPDDMPEWTGEMLDRADLRDGDKVIRRGKRGRPPLEAAKAQITLRLDPDIIAHFRAGGPGWQSRINETLRRHVRRARSGAARP